MQQGMHTWHGIHRVTRLRDGNNYTHREKMTLTDTQAIEKVKELFENGTPDWVRIARENSAVYKALVNGEGFSRVLIDKIEYIESAAKAKVRQKYSKDIRDLFERVMKPRDNVFQANGGSEKIMIGNETMLLRFNEARTNFKSNKSVFKYLSEVYFRLADVDPNGMIFIEYKMKGDEPKAYPTYKSINDIYDYSPDGQKVEYLVFNPEEKLIGHIQQMVWRIVDDATDRLISQIGDNYTIIESFDHPFGEVPGLILCETEVIGTNIRIPAIHNIMEVAKDYARDKSILTIYKFQKGYPIHWRFVTQCRKCQGAGMKGEDKCVSCDGHGYIKNTDVSDMVTLPIPDEGQPNIAPNIAGYISPDLETWKQIKIDMRDFENVMKDTIWGTSLLANKNDNLQETETATGRYIDVQPIINTLNTFADTAEYMDNTLSNWLLNFVDTIKPRGEVLYVRTYGRRYIIENPDIILTKYQEAKKTSDSSTVLDKLLEEFILSKYKNDAYMQSLMLKKMRLEPYVHMTLDQVFKSFGPQEAYAKETFNKFWATADQNKPESVLATEYEAYKATHVLEVEQEEVTI